MGDERENTGPRPGSGHEADNTAGREANAARPFDKEQPTEATPQRYPPVRSDDSVEATGEKRSFDPRADAPTPRQGAGDTSDEAINEGRLGPEADPVEGRRE